MIGFTPCLLRGLVEVDRAGQRAVVGERDRRHLEPGRLVDERRDPARPVEDRVLGVDVQVDERGAHGRAIVLARLDGCLIVPGGTNFDLADPVAHGGTTSEGWHSPSDADESGGESSRRSAA